MKIAITGYTGFLGRNLREKMKTAQYEIIPLERKDFMLDNEEFVKKLQDCEAIINLAGSPILRRWTRRTREKIYHSRIGTARKIVVAIEKMKKRPVVFISMSAIGIYKDGRVHTEKSEDFDDHFLAGVVKDWEQEIIKAKRLGVRTVCLRLGIVLSNSGGAFPMIALPFRMGLGGRIGRGKQGFPFVHIDDVLEAIIFALHNNRIEGVYNLTTPVMTDQEGFARKLAKLMKKPSIFIIPPLLLRLVFGRASSMLIKGPFVLPERLINEGFKFKYPEAQTALIQLLSKH